MKTSQIKTTGKLALILLSLGCLHSPAASAATDVSEARASDLISNRMDRKLGVYLGVSDPAPGFLGLNVAYNVTDYLRATAGYGSVSLSAPDFGTGLSLGETKLSALGAGARFMMPGWNLTPVVGLNFAKVSYSGSGAMLNGFADSGSHLYTNIGFDWQSRSGFSAGGGYQTSFRSNVGGGLYLNAGWFFDLRG